MKSLKDWGFSETTYLVEWNDLPVEIEDQAQRLELGLEKEISLKEFLSIEDKN